jgi:hypothetical protein
VDEVSLKCDECRDLGALALEVCGSAEANRFLAAHLSQEMHLAFLRLGRQTAQDGTVHAESFDQCDAPTILAHAVRGILSMHAKHFLCVCQGSTDVLLRALCFIIVYARTVLGKGIIVANLVPLDHVLAGNYRPLTAQLVTFWRFATFSISAKLATIFS